MSFRPASDLDVAIFYIFKKTSFTWLSRKPIDGLHYVLPAILCQKDRQRISLMYYFLFTLLDTFHGYTYQKNLSPLVSIWIWIFREAVSCSLRILGGFSCGFPICFNGFFKYSRRFAGDFTFSDIFTIQFPISDYSKEQKDTKYQLHFR